MNFPNKNQKDIPADFQTAISATKYGKFNLLLLLILIPSSFLVQAESSLISFIIPVASCDLNLNLSQKGLLNSMSYIGMLSTGFLWGFLLDTLGRRKILLLGFLAEIFIVTGQALSTNITMLYIFKFSGGSFRNLNNKKVMSERVNLNKNDEFKKKAVLRIGGIYVALSTYLLEFHSSEYRGKFQMACGMIHACSNIMVPLLSSAILPLDIKVSLYFLDLNAWNILSLTSSLSALISFIAFYFLPETPKFLMTIGKNDEALKVFKKIYRINTGNMEASYPIKTLIKEATDKSESAANKKSWKEYLISGLKQFSPLFGKQYRLKLLLVCLVQSLIGMGLPTFRSFLPQVFQAIHEYEIAHNGTSSNFCNILDTLRSNKSSFIEDEEPVCVVNVENSFRVYLNSVIIASAALVTFAIVVILIGIFRRKILLTTFGIMASVSINCLYFSQNIATTLAMSSIYLGALGVSFDLFITVVVVVFPTTLRAMAMSLCLFSSRSFTVIGTNLLPLLVEIGCVPPFFCLGCVSLLAVLLFWFVPDAEKEEMK